VVEERGWAVLSGIDKVRLVLECIMVFIIVRCIRLRAQIWNWSNDVVTPLDRRKPPQSLANCRCRLMV
jgi:hypothetical protein